MLYLPSHVVGVSSVLHVTVHTLGMIFLRNLDQLLGGGGRGGGREGWRGREGGVEGEGD